MKTCVLIITNCLNLIAYGQDSVLFPGHLTVSGYIKDLQMLNFNRDFSNLVSSNLIHNRINIKWKPFTDITIATELRNRVFWGEEVKLTPGFASMLRNRNEKLDLERAWIADTSFVAHTNVERVYFDYNSDNLNVRFGRQRINWGVATTWNPNDIFNTYNFLDFDYEERSGSDGGKIQYRLNNAANIEVAYANNGKKKGNIAAAKLFLNKWNYDMQIISGVYRDHVTIGMGGAGSIRDAGFKGEIQYLFKNKDSTDHLNLVIEGDYIFKNGWYFNLSLLYNANGSDKPVPAWDAVDLRISPEQLMPTKWNMTLTSRKEINPLISASTSVLYTPGTNLLIILPSLQYSIMENADISLILQSFFAEIDNRLNGVSHRCFLRMKWSF